MKTASEARSVNGGAGGWSSGAKGIAIVIAIATIGGLIALRSAPDRSESNVLAGTHSKLGAPAETTDSSVQSGPDSENPEQAVRVGREVGRKTIALLHAMVSGRNPPHVRQALIKDAAQIPMPFALAVEELIVTLQPSEQHLHKLLVGLLIDVASQSVGLMTEEEQSEFFEVAQRLADHELEIPELIPAPEIADLPKDRFEDLMHHGEVVRDPEGFHLSTLPAKSMAVYLVGMDPDSNRSAEYLSGLSWRSRNTSPRGTAALQAIRAQRVEALQ